MMTTSDNQVLCGCLWVFVGVWVCVSVECIWYLSVCACGVGVVGFTLSLENVTIVMFIYFHNTDRCYIFETSHIVICIYLSKTLMCVCVCVCVCVRVCVCVCVCTPLLSFQIAEGIQKLDHGVEVLMKLIRYML
jgi:hypothetical protein